MWWRAGGDETCNLVHVHSRMAEFISVNVLCIYVYYLYEVTGHTNLQQKEKCIRLLQNQKRRTLRDSVQLINIRIFDTNMCVHMSICARIYLYGIFAIPY